MTEFVSTESLLEPHVVEGSGDTTMVVNMGPQHPSTHGVLRLVIEIDGETVLKVVPDIGYLHTGIEKTCEAKFYQQVVPMTDRIDYLSPMSNNLWLLPRRREVARARNPREGAVDARPAQRTHPPEFAPRLARHPRDGHRRADRLPLHLPPNAKRFCGYLSTSLASG